MNALTNNFRLHPCVWSHCLLKKSYLSMCPSAPSALVLIHLQLTKPDARAWVLMKKVISLPSTESTSGNDAMVVALHLYYNQGLPAPGLHEILIISRKTREHVCQAFRFLFAYSQIPFYPFLNVQIIFRGMFPLLLLLLFMILPSWYKWFRELIKFL